MKIFTMALSKPLYIILLVLGIFTRQISSRDKPDGDAPDNSKLLEKNDGLLVAFGDYNGDQSMDLFYLESGFQKVYVYIHQGDEPNGYVKLDRELYKTSERILNVIPGNFSGNNMDLVVMTKPAGIKEGFININYVDANSGANMTSEFDPSVDAQPVFSYVGKDKIPSLIGISHKTNLLTQWDLSKRVTKKADMFNGFSCSLSHPHSNAFIDIDGDCLADMLFMCDNPDGSQSLQIWINSGEEFVKKNELVFQEPPGPLGYADMDGDGAVDIVFYSCKGGSDCTLNIVYNEQIPLCSSKIKTNCKTSDDVCRKDPNFLFNIRNMFKLPLKKYMDYRETIIPYRVFEDSIIVQNPPRLVDLDNNGAKDVLLVTSKGIVTIMNNPNSDGENEYEVSRFPLKGNHDIVTLGLRDISTDNHLEFIAVITESKKFATIILKNQYTNKGKLCRGLIHEGHCPSKCSWFSRPKIGNDSSINYGAVAKIVCHYNLSEFYISTDVVVPKTSYFSLQSPYIYMSVNDLSLYTSNFIVSVSNSLEKTHEYIYLLIFKNTHFRISPYLSKLNFWKLEVTPLGKLSWSAFFLSLSGTVSSLLACSIILALRSKTRGRRERTRVSNGIEILY